MQRSVTEAQTIGGDKGETVDDGHIVIIRSHGMDKLTRLAEGTKGAVFVRGGTPLCIRLYRVYHKKSGGEIAKPG